MLTRDAQEAYYGGDDPGLTCYLGPEVLRDSAMNKPASDIWPLGLVIAFYMRKGKHIFRGNHEVLMYKTRMATASEMISSKEENYSSTLIQLVCSMLEIKPDKRPTA